MEHGFAKLKVAAISMKPEKWKKEANAAKMESLFRKAKAAGAEVAVITEGALEGMVTTDTMRRPQLAKRMMDVTEPAEGPYIKRFMNLARSLKMCLCIGFAEKVREEAYNTAIFIDYNGVVRGAQHKMQFSEGYHPSWYFSRPGKAIRAFDTPHGRAGFLICNDRWSPDLARALVLDGAQTIYILAYGSRTWRQDKAVVSRARENGVPVVEANVGVNLIVSKGEVVAKERGFDKVTVAEIEVPDSPSESAAKRVESEYLSGWGREMHKNYVETMAIWKQRAERKRAQRR